MKTLNDIKKELELLKPKNKAVNQVKEEAKSKSTFKKIPKEERIRIIEEVIVPSLQNIKDKIDMEHIEVRLTNNKSTIEFSIETPKYCIYFKIILPINTYRTIDFSEKILINGVGIFVEQNLKKINVEDYKLIDSILIENLFIKIFTMLDDNIKKIHKENDRQMKEYEEERKRKESEMVKEELKKLDFNYIEINRMYDLFDEAMIERNLYYTNNYWKPVSNKKTFMIRALSEDWGTIHYTKKESSDCLDKIVGLLDNGKLEALVDKFLTKRGLNE